MKLKISFCYQKLIRLGKVQGEKGQMFWCWGGFHEKLILRMTSWFLYEAQHLKMLVLSSLLGSHYWNDILEFCTKRCWKWACHSRSLCFKRVGMQSYVCPTVTHTEVWYTCGKFCWPWYGKNKQTREILQFLLSSFIRHLDGQISDCVEEGCLIWKEDKVRSGTEMFGGDGSSRMVRFEFSRADNLQKKARTEEFRTEMKRRWPYYF